MDNPYILIIVIILILFILINWSFYYYFLNTKNNNVKNEIISESETSNLYSESSDSENSDSENTTAENSTNCDTEIRNKINKYVLYQLGLSNSNNRRETFKIIENANISNELSFKKISSNKLYYGLPCNYIKDDCFYDSLKKAEFILTDDIKKASLIVPCSYETTEKEINDLEKNGIKNNQYGDAVRIFMLNNTDHMVSKLALWKYLKSKYGATIASNMIPYTWDLTDSNEVELFKSQFDPKKIYITKNNYQRQEGLEIHTKLDSILNSRNKYILVQELLQDPYLISGRKINLRVYVLVIKDNYSNIKLQIYKDGFMYYTAELFEPNNPAFKKNITTGYIDRQIYIDNPLTHYDFRKWLDNPNRFHTDIEIYIKKKYPHIKLSDYIFSQIYEQLGFVFQTFESIVGTRTPGVNFQLYGVDVAINQDLKPMLMEINKGPDLSAKDGRDRELKINLCTDILKSVDLLPNIDNKFITALETVNINGNIIPIQNLIDH